MPVAPGRYVVRLQLTPAEGTIPIQTTADVFVPDAHGVDQSERPRLAARSLDRIAVCTNGRRAVPSDRAAAGRSAPGFRRTARSRRGCSDATASRLALAVTLSERVDPTLQLRLIVADVPLAPLAQGEYGLEVTLEADGKKETATYAFRLVP